MLGLKRGENCAEFLRLGASKVTGVDLSEKMLEIARTLIEEILLYIEENLVGTRQAYDGNLPSLYKRVAKQINMYPNDTKTGNSFNEILRGFISIINGLAGISNNIADRHATAKHPQKHHAKIAVNSAMIISEFLIKSFEYQMAKAEV